MRFNCTKSTEGAWSCTREGSEEEKEETESSETPEEDPNAKVLEDFLNGEPAYSGFGTMWLGFRGEEYTCTEGDDGQWTCVNDK